MTLETLESGRAFKGFKHLIELISGKQAQRVLTLENTRREGGVLFCKSR